MILTATGFMNSIVELITVLLIFVFVLALTYYVTRFIAGYQKTKTAQGNLSVIEVIRVSNSQYIQLLRAGKDQYLVIGVSKDQISLLTTLSEDQLRELPTDTQINGIKAPGKSFSQILEGLKDKHEK